MRIVGNRNMKPCANCGKVQNPIEYTIFRFSKDGMKPYYSKWCRTCQNENKLILKEIKKNHRPPPSGTPCQCCGRIDRLYVDHCRHTRTLRGFICKNCNTGLGMLGDSLEGVQLAVRYLERWKCSTRLTTDSEPQAPPS
jgi:hypothetical protein